MQPSPLQESQHTLIVEHLCGCAGAEIAGIILEHNVGGMTKDGDGAELVKEPADAPYVGM